DDAIGELERGRGEGLEEHGDPGMKNACAGGVAARPTTTLASARATLDEYRSVGSRVGARVDPLADGLHETLAQAQRTLAEIRGAAASLEMVLGGNATLWHDLGLTLDQLATAAQSISALADFLKAHPNALISGRRTPRGSPDRGRAAD
ncbi:MAG TPA: hypothetical protein PK640_22135, partial [Verrucomicrobiota bacterium]|nr:hypothetical protein [Verrucomicrobiota bacterium]